MAYNYNKSGSGLILGFCIIAILVVSNEADLNEGYKRCSKYCLEELKAKSYDCKLFCFFKCAPSMGGSGCFKSMEQAGQSLNIPEQFLVEGPASEPTSFERWTREMNSNSNSKSKSISDFDSDFDSDGDFKFKSKSNSNSNSGVGLN